MRAVAEHDIEQDHGHLRICGLLQDPLPAQRLVDHGVRTAASEGIVAEIDDRVPLAAPDVREHQLRSSGVFEAIGPKASVSSSSAS